MKKLVAMAIVYMLACALPLSAFAEAYTPMDLPIDPIGLLTDDWLHNEESQAWFTSAMWLNYTLSVPEEERVFDADLTSSTTQSFMFLDNGVVAVILNKPHDQELVMMYATNTGKAGWFPLEFGDADDIESYVQRTFLVTWCHTDSKVRAEVYAQALELFANEISAPDEE